MPKIRITSVAVAIVGILSASHAALAQSSTRCHRMFHFRKHRSVQNGNCALAHRLQCAWSQPSRQQTDIKWYRTELDCVRRSARAAAGHDATAHIIEDRSKGSDSFTKIRRTRRCLFLPKTDLA